MRISILVVAFFALTTHLSAATTEIRALWVTRGEYRDAEDVQKIVANAAATNFNVILFQVRGNGTVFYQSKIEPWAFELSGNDPANTGKDPGWDPLRVAVDEAHRHGVELHAWVNVFPAWRSQTFPPQSVKQLWWTHPEWFMHDAAGEKMMPRDHRVDPKVEDWYAFISPGVPEVQDYLADLCEELVKNYDVDGLHYDYVRYPREIREVKEQFKDRAEKLGNWSYDPVSLKRFAKETGIAKPDDNPEKWFAWRADQVTATVKKIADRVRAVRPKLIISAAVGADPEDAKRGKGQSYIEWMDKGLVDAVFLMGYTDELAKFENQCVGAMKQKPAKGYMSAGIGTRARPKVVADEIGIARKLSLDGFAGFSYGGLFNISKGHQAGPLADKLKGGALAEAATPPWKDVPAKR